MYICACILLCAFQEIINVVLNIRSIQIVHICRLLWLFLYSLSTYILWYIGLSVTPGLVPPSGVRSNNTAATNSQFRYNLNTGAAFNISCSSTHTSSDFTVSFYKDGAMISDGDLEDTTLTLPTTSTTQKFIQLEFLNFQPVHDGVYHCSTITSDTNEELSSDLYLYGSGEDCMCVSRALIYV